MILEIIESEKKTQHKNMIEKKIKEEKKNSNHDKSANIINSLEI